jgi:hypothetical protein
VVDADAEGHAAVGRAVAEQHPVVVVLADPGLQHAAVEDLRKARVEGGALARLVLGPVVLAVHDLGGHDERCRVVEELDLVGHDDEVAVLERHEPRRAHPHVLAARGRPDEVTPQDALAEVEAALVLGEPGGGQVQRLVVDVELEVGRIRHVHDRLAGARKTVGVLGVDDRPRLVEAVHERAR